MYMPNLTPRDAHRLWLDANDENEFNPSIQPLSSYSPSYPGSLNMIKLDQSRQREFFKPINTNDKIDASLNVKNLINCEYLESFGKMGYNALKPIGVNKTMQQLDEERLELEELQRNNIGDFYGNEEEERAVSSTADINNNNNNSTTNSNNNDQSFDMLLGENTRSMNNTSITSATTNPTVNNLFHFENNQDFMAEDEEYQDDHSISMDSDTTSRASARSMFTNTLPTTSTLQTSVYEGRSYFRNVSNGSTNGMSNLRNEVGISNANSD